MKILVLGRADYALLQRRLSELAALDHEVHLASLQRGVIPGVAVWPLRALGGPLKYFGCLPAVRSTIARVKPDVIDAHGATTYGLYGLTRVDDIPFVATVSGSDITVGARRYPLLAQVARRSLERADSVFASSTAASDYIGEILQLDLGARLVTHTWGVPVDAILDGARDREAIRRELETPPGAPVVLHNRCMVRHWRVLSILESIPLVVRRIPDIRFWFAYAPLNGEARRYLARVERRIDELGIRGHVRLLGPQTYERMLAVLQAADLFICVGESDLLASSVLEALCAGKVPILNRLPAYAEVLGAQSEFFLSEVSPSCIADRIATASLDLDGYTRRLAPTIERIRADHDSMAASRWLCRLYRRVASGYAQRA